MPHHPALDADRWMDRETTRSTQPKSLLGVAVAAGRVPKRLYRFIFTAPGLMTLIAGLVVTAILAAGGAMVYSSSIRQNEINTLINQTEPLANSSQELFSSLSTADSLATTGFLKQGSSVSESEAEYTKAVQDATNAILRASHGIEDVSSREMEIVLIIQEQLPKYITLVAQAQTNDRVRNPVGASYLTEASSLMQNSLLPKAQELYSLTSGQVSTGQRELRTPMWFPLSGLVAAVIILLIMQFWLAARSHRRINVGYVAATGLMLIALLWASGSAGYTWTTGNQEVDGGAQPLGQLTQARISAQQARTDEALGLVQRDYSVSRQQNFSNRMTEINQILEKTRDEVDSPGRSDKAREALRLWDKSHATLLYHMQNGESGSSTDSTPASGDNPEYSEPSYSTLDSQLQELISELRENLRDTLMSSQKVATRVTLVVTILTVIAAICVLAGTRPRLREYL
ncbi:hypothetical protein [Corynebacterium anserum]|uniref:Uncharacterized protein n=1 Tax=Corynebacterium anserum TaxID=2684406 RepID=A0A7G7YLY9_9CORY|nr:hypothetical protein [Corynebacterium anserum]MBC2681324.1 hypothetical protein [Corynebacterium anserum]QNH95509.1 hypothetical protein GP473_01250 [Corynebacterium anserum]